MHRLLRFQPRFLRRSIPAHFASLALFLLLTTPAFAQNFLAAADERNLWLLIPSEQPGQVHLFHRLDADPPDILYPLGDFRAQPFSSGLAAAADQLWIVDRSRLVFRGRISESAARRSWSSQLLPALPPGVQLLSLAADPDGLWALVRLESSSALGNIDTLPRFVPSSTSPPSSDESSSAFGSSSQAASSSAYPLERLLRLHRFRWHRFDLPADWPSHPRAAFLVSDWPAGVLPWLLCTRTGSSSSSELPKLFLWRPLHRSAAAFWSPAYSLDLSRSPLAVTALQGQLLLAWPASSSTDLQLDLHLIRPPSPDSSSAAPQLVPLGQIQLRGLSLQHPWALLSWANTLVLLARSSSSGSASSWLYSRMDLRGQLLADSQELHPFQSSWLTRSSEYLVLLAVVLAAVLIFLVAWQRDPALQRLELPSHLRLADLSVRALAGLIDLLPCAVPVAFFFGLSPHDMLQRWPGSASSGLQALWPGLLVIALYLTHCTLSELLTARTLGKALLGLRVTDLQGAPPRPWQVLLRNLLKILDLTAWLLLILPILSPNRQRLGDLIARTVVVTRTASASPPESSDES